MKRGVDTVPVQRPRHLNQVCFTLLTIQVELLGIRERDCGRLEFAHLDVPAK